MSSSNKRQHLLLSTNQTIRNRPKRWRNRLLSWGGKALLLGQLKKYVRLSWLWIFLLLMMTAFIIFAIFSPYFHVKEIQVVRDDPHIDLTQINEELADIYGRNLLFLTQQEVADALIDKFPEFREVQFVERWPDTIELKIKLSPPFFTLLNQNTANFSVISADGIVLSSDADQDLPVLKVLDYDKLILPRQTLASPQTMNKIHQALLILEQDLKLPIVESRWFLIARELRLVTDKDVQIWLDLQLDIPQQLHKLELSLAETGVYKGRAHHIDLRIPDNVFWQPF